MSQSTPTNPPTDTDTDTDTNTTDDGDGIPDVSFDDKERVESPGEANELYNRLSEGRSATDELDLAVGGKILPCQVNLNRLNGKTRWDCLNALPDGMFRQAGVESDQNIELESSVIPNGDGFELLQQVVVETVSCNYLENAAMEKIIKEDLRDDAVLEIGMNILVMAMDRGQVDGFRFGNDAAI